MTPTTPSNGPGPGSTTGVSAPSLTHSAPIGAGTHTTTFDDIVNAGFDPLGSFAAAAALNRTVGNARVNAALTRIASGTPEPAAPDLPKIPAAEPAFNEGAANKFLSEGATDKAATSARSATAAAEKPPTPLGRAAVQNARNNLAKKFAEDGARQAVREASVLAARGGARLGAAAALRAAALGIPGLGTALTVLMWAIDPDFRRGVNNLISSILGPGGAPDLNAPPEPPRTQFLPLTHDGNRDAIIERMDGGMVRANEAAFRFNPAEIWSTDAPAIQTTTNFSDVIDKINVVNNKLNATKEAISGAYKAHPDEPYVADLWSKTKPGVEAFSKLQSEVLPAIGSHVSEGAVGANNAYQAFRQVNIKNRQEINNSTSGMIPFAANKVNESHMSDATGEMRSAVDNMARTAQALTAAADPFTIVANRSGNGGSTGRTQSVTPSTPAAPAAPSTLPPAGPAGPAAKADNPAKDLASMLRNAMPGGGMPMPAMPQIPNLGSGMPQIPGLNNPAGKPLDLAPKDLKDKLEAKAKEKDNEKPEGPKKPGEAPTPPTTGPAAVQGKTVNASNPAPAPGTPTAANTTKIGGKDWTFDSPKLKDLAHNMTGSDGAGHKSLRQAATEAGFKLPPPGQDIGKPITNPADLKPGHAIMGENNHNGVYLGEQGGQAWAVDENGKLVPLKEIAKFNGPHTGFFELFDDGSPAASQTQQTANTQQQAAAQQSSTPTTADTHNQVGQAQNRGTPGLNPGTAPTGS